MWNYSPVIKPMPPLLMDDVCGDKQVCVSFACEFIPYLLGLLEIYRWPDRFTGTPEEQEHSAGLFRELMEVLAMACCGDGTSNVTLVILHRINEETGRPEISIDGGSVWTPDPADPAATVYQYPPPVTSGVLADKCDAATNGQEHLKSHIQEVSSNLAAGLTIAQFIIAIVELIIAAAIMVITGGAASPAFLALCAMLYGSLVGIYNLGQAAFNAYWTEENYDIILCALYCTIGDNGSFTGSEYRDFLNKLRADLPGGIVRNWFIDEIKAMGAPGLNNFCAYGNAPIGDCAACDCSCVSNFVLWYDKGTNLVTGSDENGDYIQADSVFDGANFGGHVVCFTTNDPDQCCIVGGASSGVPSNGSGTWFYDACGETITPLGSIFPHQGLIPTGLVNTVGHNGTMPFTLKLYFI